MKGTSTVQSLQEGVWPAYLRAGSRGLRLLMMNSDLENKYSCNKHYKLREILRPLARAMIRLRDSPLMDKPPMEAEQRGS